MLRAEAQARAAAQTWTALGALDENAQAGEMLSLHLDTEEE